jgi:hypothetical protein
VLIFQAQDDKRDGALSLEDLLPNEPVHPISYDALLILLGMYNVQVRSSLNQTCFSWHVYKVK